MGRGALDETIREAARPLAADTDLEPLLDRVADARVVLLGEASHGTAEYYRWRDRISRRLIEEHGFDFIAVEGDWPDCYELNRYVRGMSDAGNSAREVLGAFTRWPTWMWANREVMEMAEWLRGRNAAVTPEERTGFYGLDVYSLWESMEAVLEYLEGTDAEAAERARQAYGCFDPYQSDVQEYAMATRFVPESCEEEVVGILRDLQSKRTDVLRKQARDSGRDGIREASFNAEQNALVARNAERYYRTMSRGGPDSWNLRDTHMIETLERLLEHHGPETKAIVWEHNTHIGDARATDMAAAGMVNVGQLARERWGADDVVLVGFSSHSGSVIAGRWWGAPMERMVVPPARRGSWEDLFHELGLGDGILRTDAIRDVPAARDRRGHRAIGVVYNPAQEKHGNYVPTVLPDRYDVLVHIDSSRALEPLHFVPEEDGEPAETFPSGL